MKQKKKSKEMSQTHSVVNKVCGFEAPEVLKLYAFVDAYEWSDIRQLKNETELFRVHPELMGLKECMDKVSFHKSNAEEMNRLDVNNLQNEIYGSKHGSLLLSFLYHLRNAIAHACVEKKGEMVQVTTFFRKCPVAFSARGRIELSIIEQFTNELKMVKL
ncbi:MAG: hypothetical protein IJ197_06540 [Bacteroidaceae bacterium]|nr:hypothetical protein [Bacteroidaceae bacterium]